MNRPWGRWTRQYLDDQVELRLLEIEPEGYCTRHRHEYVANVLFLLLGELEVWQFDSPEPQCTVLSPTGRTMTIPPGSIHQFRARTRVVAYELNVALGPGPLDPLDSVQFSPAGRGELP